jgi:hypothetical protein
MVIYGDSRVDSERLNEIANQKIDGTQFPLQIRDSLERNNFFDKSRIAPDNQSQPPAPVPPPQPAPAPQPPAQPAPATDLPPVPPRTTHGDTYVPPPRASR